MAFALASLGDCHGKALVAGRRSEAGVRRRGAGPGPCGMPLPVEPEPEPVADTSVRATSVGAVIARIVPHATDKYERE